MAWHRRGDKPLSEPMMISLLTHICVTRPQWVNSLFRKYQSSVLLAIKEGNPPVTSGFPSQRASNAENVSTSAGFMDLCNHTLYLSFRSFPPRYAIPLIAEWSICSAGRRLAALWSWWMYRSSDRNSPPWDTGSRLSWGLPAVQLSCDPACQVLDKWYGVWWLLTRDAY